MTYRISEEAESVIRALNSAGYSAYIVGGAVRDLVMNKAPHDWDIATSALPGETEKVFEGNRVIETGIKHGTVTVIENGKPFEITSFRIESGYSDKRRPDSVSFTTDLECDLSRRDFTCNALAYHPDEGIVDCFGGISDIENKIIRCVGDPDKRFDEDALRILRALRFASVLGFEIDKETAASLKRNAKLLEYVSSERIFIEISKLLCGINVKEILLDYPDVIFGVFPELAPMKGCAQNHERHIYDVWEHTVCSVSEIRADRDLRLAMLFHDCGKPSVKFTDENGIDHFYGHADKSVETADAVLRRMKTSNSIRKHVTDLIKYHGFVPQNLSEKTYGRYIRQLGEETVRELFEVRLADVKAQSPDFLAEEIENNRKGLETLENYLSSNNCFSLRNLAVSGNDLMQIGFSGDRNLGKALNILLDEVIGKKINNEKSALLKRAKEILKND